MERVMKLKFWLLPIICLAGLALGMRTAIGASKPPQLAPLSPPAAGVSSQALLSGTGVVEPASEVVSVGIERSGIVSHVLIEAGSQVLKGEPLFCLDDRAARADLAVREAELEVAHAELRKVRSGPREEDVLSRKAQLAEASANLAQAREDRERMQRLVAVGAVAREQAEARDHAFEAAEAKSAQARSELQRTESGAWRRDRVIAEARYSQAEALVARSAVELELLCARAQQDGVVLQVSVRSGEHVVGGGQRELVLMGSRALRVRAEFEQSDFLRFSPRALAYAAPHGDPEHKLGLRYVRTEPMVVPKKTFTGAPDEQGDVRVAEVIYALPDNAGLRVGQRVDLSVLPQQPERTEIARAAGAGVK
jgi:HlyD family secretion protein